MKNTLLFCLLLVSSHLCAQAPSVAAPTPTQDETNDNVLSVYCSEYTDLAGTGFDPNWSQATVQTFETIAGDETNKYANLNYQGTQLATAQDVSGHEFFHVDFWTSDATVVQFFLISVTTGEQKVDLTVTQNQWVSVDIPLTSYTNQGLGISDIHQFKVVGDGGVTVYFDNWFFHGTVVPPPPPTTTDITFCVDLSCFSSVTAPTIFGAFNGWNAGANPVTDPDGDGEYCTTLPFLAGAHEYKFFFQEEDQENLFTPEDDACTITTGAFTNRIVTVVDGVTQDLIFGWETCDAVCTPIDPPVEPAVHAPDPIVLAGDVISMFSEVYTDTGVDTWLTGWSNATLNDIQINGNDTKLYTNLVFFGVETTGANLIDASTMTKFHIDIWTPDMTVLKIKLVDFGPNGVYQGGDDSEHELIFNNPTQEEWVSYEILLSDFTGLTSTANIAQLIISGDAPAMIGGSGGDSDVAKPSAQSIISSNAIVELGTMSADNDNTSSENSNSSSQGFLAPATLYLDNVFFSKPAALPVELTSFEAKAMTGRTFIEWATASETNNDYFQVEKSTNGRSFEAIGKVLGVGNSAKVENYSIWDNSPSAGINYYRLKQVDLDGSSEYSDVVSLRFESDEMFRLVNKTVQGDNVKMAYNIVDEGSYMLISMDVTGRVISNQEVILASGLNELTFETSSKGILLTMLTNGDQTIVEKVFK